MYLDFKRRALLVIPESLRYLFKAIRGILYFFLHGKSWFKFALQPIQNYSVRVCYGHIRVPQDDELIHGGMVKFQRLEQSFPNSPTKFNILYLGSSALPLEWLPLSRLAHRKGAKLILNQNGVLYPGLGPGWQEMNRPMKELVHAADYVFYQSWFCKKSADLFLGNRTGAWEILYNAVDTTSFTPATNDPDPKRLVLLLGGSQYEFYRLETSLRTLAIVAKSYSQAHLLVSGRLSWLPDEAKAMKIARRLTMELGITDRVDFLGPYSQSQAPDILRRVHILLHPKYNDPCPGLVTEAMACGLPVVYSKSGGVPELVGDDAGVGVPAKLNWEEPEPPNPEDLARAVLEVSQDRKRMAEAARQRAMEKFDLKPWIERHKEVFNSFVG
jgi:glycosyltransferase involved in cell wall biosynthesis